MDTETTDRGTLIPADRILNRVFVTVAQWERDLEAAADFVEYESDCDGGRWIPTLAYIDAKGW